MPSIYHQLREGHVRLLTLYPRQDSGLISCSLTIHSLCDGASTPSYVALSYVWGPETQTFEIIVDNERVSVRENLYNFLLQAAPHDGLWIDALCINQQDNCERSQQVQLMGRIYGQARMVWAWLGPAEDAELRNALLELRQYPLKYIYAIEYRPRRAQHRLYFDKLHDLSQYKYWSRAWVVQEFLLAKEVQLVYGDVHIDPRLISSLISSQQTNALVLARMRHDEIDSHNRRDHFRGIKRPGMRYGDVTGSTLPNHASLMHSLCTQRGNYGPRSGASNEPVLMWLLHNNHKRECHEPRDKIYSLLSLVSGNNSAGQRYEVDVDYSAHISSVFYSVMKGVLLRYDTIFAYGTALRRTLRIYELPTQTGMSEQQGEIYIDVAGFIDGEVVEVIDLNDIRIEGKQSPGIWGNNSPPLLLAQLQEPYPLFLPESKYHPHWEEDWLVESSYQDGQRSEVANLQRVSTCHNQSIDRDGHGEESVLHLLFELAKLQPKDLKWVSKLAEELNKRGFPQAKLNSNQSNVNTLKFDLVVMKFRTQGATQGATKVGVNSVVTHYFKADYILGLSHGNLSVGNKILSFPHALPGFAFSLSNETTTHLTGAIRWVHDPKRTRLGISHSIWRGDGFPSYSTLLSPVNYLYPRVIVKMRAEEVLQLTPV